MITLKQTLTNYKREHTALPAFNIDSFEIYQAVEFAVRETGLPCIVQLSENEDAFIIAERLFLLVKKANLEGLPIYLNMDHGHNLQRLMTLVKLGFDMVHFDGSSLNYQENLSKTTAFIKEVKLINPGCFVEIEFNKINLVEKSVSPGSFTDPNQALEFMTQTGADLLASSIGNLHGVNTAVPEVIDLNLLKNITNLLPDTFLTLHGGSGISSDQISSAINLGIVKININTDVRLQFKKSLIRSMTEVNSEKIYDYLNPVITDVKNIIAQKLIQFQNHV